MMDMTVVVDASVWVSRLIPQDVNHSASVLWTERYTKAGGILAAPAFLLIEVAASVSRLTGQKALSKKVVEDLNNTDTMNIIPMDSTLVLQW